jgi:hypothetical protein
MGVGILVICSKVNVDNWPLTDKLSEQCNDGPKHLVISKGTMGQMAWAQAR